jgi:hypothetical protein
MRVMVDDWAALEVWASISIAMEDHLGINAPGINDGALLKAKKCFELTLRDLASLVTEQFPRQVGSYAHAVQCVQGAAEKVSRREVLESDFERPILQVLQLPHWKRSYGS